MKMRRRQSLPIRLLAMAALDELERRGHADDRETAYRLNEILWAALFNPEGGGDWRPFVPVTGIIEDVEIWNRFLQELEIRYRPPGSHVDERKHRKQWLTTARSWVERLPEDNAGEWM